MPRIYSHHRRLARLTYHQNLARAERVGRRLEIFEALEVDYWGNTIVRENPSGTVSLGARISVRKGGQARLLQSCEGVEPVIAELTRLGMRVIDSWVLYTWQRDLES